MIQLYIKAPQLHYGISRKTRKGFYFFHGLKGTVVLWDIATQGEIGTAVLNKLYSDAVNLEYRDVFSEAYRDRVHITVE
jgi:hypothetical protein